VYEQGGRITREGIRIHDAGDFAGMHAAGQVVARILDDIAEHVFPGQTTAELDRIITDMVPRMAPRRPRSAIAATSMPAASASITSSATASPDRRR
jgi:methionine aminopeptidase